MANLKEIGKLLVLLGGIIGLIEGILLILGTSLIILPDLSTFGLPSFVLGILGILFSLIALVNSGFIKMKALEFKNKWLIILVMGILMYIFASHLGGILVIIGAILFLL